MDILLILCFRNLSISMDIHGYPAKDGLDMDMDMYAIFHLHGQAWNSSILLKHKAVCIFIYIVQSNLPYPGSLVRRVPGS